MNKSSRSRIVRRKHGNRTVIAKQALTRDNNNRIGVTSADAVPLSDEAALRKMLALSPDGQAMLFAMIRYVVDTRDTNSVLEAAAKGARLDLNKARRGVVELIDASLLRRQDDGSMVLHRVLGGVANEWSKPFLRRDADSSNILVFG